MLRASHLHRITLSDPFSVLVAELSPALHDHVQEWAAAQGVGTVADAIQALQAGFRGREELISSLGYHARLELVWKLDAMFEVDLPTNMALLIPASLRPIVSLVREQYGPKSWLNGKLQRILKENNVRSLEQLVRIVARQRPKIRTVGERTYRSLSELLSGANAAVG